MQELQLKNNPVVDADSTTKQIKQLMSNASASGDIISTRIFQLLSLWTDSWKSSGTYGSATTTQGTRTPGTTGLAVKDQRTSLSRMLFCCITPKQKMQLSLSDYLSK